MYTVWDGGQAPEDRTHSLSSPILDGSKFPTPPYGVTNPVLVDVHGEWHPSIGTSRPFRVELDGL